MFFRDGMMIVTGTVTRAYYLYRNRYRLTHTAYTFKLLVANLSIIEMNIEVSHIVICKLCTHTEQT